MSDAFPAVAVLFLIAGGGIIVVDAFIIRKLRQGGDSRKKTHE
jgi:hypothetical protein